MSNCTEVMARYISSAIDVCRVGDRTALHCATAFGVVVVMVPTTEFVIKCRGPRDHNGHTLPNPEDLRRDVEERGVIAPAAPEAAPAANWKRSRQLAPKLLAAWAELKQTPWIGIRAMELRYGFSHGQFAGWVSRNRREEWQAIREQRQPVLKPGGKIL